MKSTSNRENSGFTLIEILIGILLLSIAGFMALSFFRGSTEMGRKTMAYADFQLEGRKVLKDLTDGVMNGNAIGFSEDEDSLLFFLGTAASSEEKTEYIGELFFFDKAKGCLYKKRKDSFTEWEEKISDKQAIKTSVCQDEYLILDSLCQMAAELWVNDDMAGADKKEYSKEDRVMVKFTLDLFFQDGGAYKVESAVSARNKTDIWWEGADGYGNFRDPC